MCPTIVEVPNTTSSTTYHTAQLTVQFWQFKWFLPAPHAKRQVSNVRVAQLYLVATLDHQQPLTLPCTRALRTGLRLQITLNFEVEVDQSSCRLPFLSHFAPVANPRHQHLQSKLGKTPPASVGDPGRMSPQDLNTPHLGCTFCLLLLGNACTCAAA
ncbi:hypothetical protein BT63DRAFT_137206 [Microthyrium microscopicum]|uniref:Uncharacterized protein n=1 Tax=Microthyrium microscopicum TaxID=703497 RepID=A0A6A6UMT8_9PEZI|nr:hypothetical protein BT63DRAFT_137206 [Microthyrium microscopicum]